MEYQNKGIKILGGMTMAEFEITHNFSNEGTRNEVRMRVVELLSTEDPGTGNGNNATRYTYYVETLIQKCTKDYICY